MFLEWFFFLYFQNKNYLESATHLYISFIPLLTNNLHLHLFLFLTFALTKQPKGNRLFGGGKMVGFLFLMIIICFRCVYSFMYILYIFFVNVIKI